MQYDKIQNSKLIYRYSRKTVEQEGAGQDGAARISVDISRDTLQRLNVLTQKTDVQIEVLFLTAWTLLVSYYSANETVAFAVQSYHKADILPVFIEADNNKSVKSLIYECKGKFEAVKDDLSKELDKIDSFSMLYFEGSNRSFDIHSMADKCEIALAIAANKDAVSAYYRGTEEERKLVKALLENYISLLKKITIDENKEVYRLKILSDKEENKVVFEFNNSGVSYQGDKCIQELFEMQAESFPDKIAVEDESTSLSYSALNLAANRLANYLRKKGVGTESCVGIIVERSYMTIVSILAVLKAGGTYVPFDPEYAKTRIKYMIEDTKPAVIITQASLIERIPEEYSSLLVLDAQMSEIEQEDDKNPSCINTPEQLAYINYTSGSTGEPKGVMIPHIGVTRLVLNTNYIDITPEDCFLFSSPISFDAATFEIWGALLNGGRVVVLKKEALLSPGDMERIIESRKVTTMFLTTSLFNRFAELCPHIYSKLKCIITGGDVVSVTHFKKALDAAKKTSFVHAYGPTENTSFSCCYKVKTLEKDAYTIPIGGPIANSTVYILDKYMRPLPVGAVGEIYVGGDGLARGYLNAEEKNAQVFVKSPFSKDKACCLYKTGDLGRWLPEGAVEFCGRIDNQVKIRGFRIEPGEIEKAILSLDTIQHCVVEVDKSTDSKKLIAYYVGEKVMEKQYMKEALKELIPEYMIPNDFYKIDYIPLTDNGKIDWTTLKKLRAERLSRSSNSSIPANKDEAVILDIWKEILNRQDIGLTESFFELGGDSLLLMKLNKELNKQYNREIPVVALFKYSTVKALAEYINSNKNSKEVLANRLNKRLNRN